MWVVDSLPEKKRTPHYPHPLSPVVPRSSIVRFFRRGSAIAVGYCFLCLGRLLCACLGARDQRNLLFFSIFFWFHHWVYLLLPVVRVTKETAQEGTATTAGGSYPCELLLQPTSVSRNGERKVAHVFAGSSSSSSNCSSTLGV